MNTKRINELMERYLAGETDHQEESELAALIKSEGVQGDYLLILQMLESTAAAPLLTSEDIKAATAGNHRRIKPMLWIGSAAAILLLMIGIRPFFSTESQQQNSVSTVVEKATEKTQPIPDQPAGSNLLASKQDKPAKERCVINKSGKLANSNNSDNNLIIDKPTDFPESSKSDSTTINTTIDNNAGRTITTTQNGIMTNAANSNDNEQVYSPFIYQSHRSLSFAIAGGTINQTVGSTASTPSQHQRRTAKLKNPPQPAKGRHHLPWSVGINARYSLNKHWAIESGLVYTHLRSELQAWGEEEWTTQRLHYVGIPMKADYKFLTWNNISCYVNGGGMIEKCIYATNDGDNYSVPELQFSTNLSAGAEYHIDDRLSLYLESGAAYYIENNDNVKSIRKASPVTVNITGGLRININPENK